MNQTIKLLAISLCIAGTSSCTSMFQNNNSPTHRPYGAYPQDQTVYYPQGHDRGRYGEDSQHQSQQVDVPNSYHVGAYHSPVPHRNRDRNWINSQNPMGYTIEVADDAKAAAVAGKLHSVPKNNRKAEVQYSRGGTTHYKGLYGTFGSYQAAKQALNALPPDIKASARVKNWGTVQGTINH